MGEYKGESDTAENGDTTEENEIDEFDFNTGIEDISPDDAAEDENPAGVGGAGDEDVKNVARAGEEVSAHATKRSHTDVATSADAENKRMKI